MSSLKDGLITALSLTKVPGSNSATPRPEILQVEMLENGCVRATLLDTEDANARLRSLNVLFLELRRKVRELTQDPTWTIRYASRVDQPLLPFLHSSGQLKVLIDPMQPYRSPIDALDKDRILDLIYLPSHAYYFKPKHEVPLRTLQVERNDG